MFRTFGSVHSPPEQPITSIRTTSNLNIPLLRARSLAIIKALRAKLQRLEQLRRVPQMFVVQHVLEVLLNDLALVGEGVWIHFVHAGGGDELAVTLPVVDERELEGREVGKEVGEEAC